MAAKDQMIDKTYFIRDGGEMGKRIRSFDWCKTPLGAIENWPGNLGNLVNLCLHSRFPMFIFWGETHITIYNDAYSKIMGLKHPGALGEPAKTVWPEIWSKIGSILETIMQTGKAAVCNNNLLLLNRNGFIEETYFTFSYSPVEGENGKTEGIFCIATETTEAVTGERQLQTLTRLNKNILNITSDHDVYQKSMEAIRENPEDFPFAILYALSRDGKKLLIADQTTSTLAKFFPNEIDLSENKGEYHELVDAALKNVPVICTEMKEPFGQLPRTNGEQTPVTGLVLPVAHSQQKIPYAILKVGINPHRIFDNKYQLFFELVANQIANGINKSRIGEMRNAFPGADYNLANPYAVKELLEGNEAQVKMALSKKHIEQQFGQLLEQAPVAIALLRGPSFVVDIMNEVALDILGKPSAQLMNKPLFESIPELKKQGFETVVNGVFTTGKGVVIEETPVQMVRHGKEETIFARIVFKALYEENGTISGVMAAAHDMTEHVTARKKIEVSETRYRQLVQGISIALYTCDKEGRILLYNDAAVELWGREPEVGVDLWCGSWKTLDSHGQKLDLANCPIAVALKYGRVESFEIIVERPDGTRRHVMPYPQPMFDDKGNITGAINLLLDITENKKVMAALQHSEARFSNIISQLGAGIAQTDTHGKFIAVNDKFCQLVGLSKKRLLQMSLPDVVYPEDLQSNMQLLKECIEEGKSFTVEKRYMKPDGSLVWVNNSMSLIKGADNQKFLTAVSIDITEAKKMEARLTESENRFRNVANSIPALIWIANAEGRCVYLNKQWYDYTGQTEKEALGDGWLQSVHPTDGKITLDTFFNAKVNETPFVMEFRLKDGEGNYQWFLNSGVPHYNEHGNFQGYIGSCTDITDNKKLSQQKDEFMGVVSHELKTPVTSLKAFTQLLEMKFSAAGNQNASAIMRRMDTQINKLNSLISDLLDITRLDEGKIHFKTESFSFTDLVTETVEELQRISPSHTITTEIQFNCILDGDRERIGQVLTNFITNAVKYSPKSNRVIVRVTVKDSSVTCSVKDFGIGIDKSKQSLIFNRFYRVDGDQSDTFPGLGLGLYISAEIIKRQRGTIGFESEPGKGSVFYFSLPAQKIQ